ncbi:hypothetical protein J5N97_005173 [Dioscorea zingiberensis]|uniref:Uncharacterized protein n=1 Tax=Dioscorea zingiberensis TaxID=325984 RepID=A0A9D5DA61_9LILI|nr:hypothetical protein J5N97_005173 [Dioscorea zingiberensis]
MELSTRFNTMLLGFFFSLLVFGDCIAHANHVNGMQVRMNEAQAIDKELGDQENYNSMDVSQTRSKVLLGGRKMGVEYYVEEKKESSMKTGANPNVGKYCGNGMKGKLNIQWQFKITSVKPFASSNSNTNRKGVSSSRMDTRAIFTKQGRESSFHEPEKTINSTQVTKSSSVNKEDPLEAATQEIFDMLNRDYHPKGHRKPPVNNHVPIHKP